MMISNLKRCTAVAFIATRKHTRTRRWRTVWPSRGQGQGLDKAVAKGPTRLTNWTDSPGQHKQGLDKAALPSRPDNA